MLETEQATFDKLMGDFKVERSVALTPEQIKLILNKTHLGVCGLESVFIDLEDNF